MKEFFVYHGLGLTINKRSDTNTLRHYFKDNVCLKQQFNVQRIITTFSLVIKIFLKLTLQHEAALKRGKGNSI